ncbi:uncharacterized protein LOC143029984 [Oratosquilla oratoria]|uniref:uncharacterized protein LOC143029984 n=1 Tax=Oratosquilla oratoria TaxID=337810 RepID=UPI003F76A295
MSQEFTSQSLRSLQGCNCAVGAGAAEQQQQQQHQGTAAAQLHSAARKCLEEELVGCIDLGPLPAREVEDFVDEDLLIDLVHPLFGLRDPKGALVTLSRTWSNRIVSFRVEGLLPGLGPPPSGVECLVLESLPVHVQLQSKVVSHPVGLIGRSEDDDDDDATPITPEIENAEGEGGHNARPETDAAKQEMPWAAARRPGAPPSVASSSSPCPAPQSPSGQAHPGRNPDREARAVRILHDAPRTQFDLCL